MPLMTGDTATDRAQYPVMTRVVTRQGTRSGSGQTTDGMRRADRCEAGQHHTGKQ